MPGLKQGVTKKSAEAYYAEAEVFSNLLYGKIQKSRRLYAGFSLELFFKKGIGADSKITLPEKPVRLANQPKSAEISCQLFEAGKTPDEIAAERNLAPGTIFGHLSEGVEQGRIDIYNLIPEDTIKLIEKALPENPHEVTSTSAIKLVLGDEVSYNEIRCVLAWKKVEYARNIPFASPQILTSKQVTQAE
ncbi:MAG: helix-turn-helix domain-containing protein [Chitinophagaceae bacterium]|nr:helix-turn-helix domain-containing protein [Chitinophagaceae bacterium]